MGPKPCLAPLLSRLALEIHCLCLLGPGVIGCHVSSWHVCVLEIKILVAVHAWQALLPVNYLLSPWFVLSLIYFLRLPLLENQKPANRSKMKKRRSSQTPEDFQWKSTLWRLEKEWVCRQMEVLGGWWWLRTLWAFPQLYWERESQLTYKKLLQQILDWSRKSDMV